MSAYILHQAATVQCSHLGAAQPTMVYQRVLLSGSPVVVKPPSCSVTGCQLPLWTAGGSPACVTGTWTSSAQRVVAGGSPVVLFDSQSQCTPNNTPLQILQTQMRVMAT